MFVSRQNPLNVEPIKIYLKKKTLKCFFLLEGHKVDFIAVCGAKKFIFDPLVKNNRV